MDSNWRGGLPNPCGHPRGGAAGGGWFGGVPVGDTGPIDAPLPLPVPAVPLPASVTILNDPDVVVVKVASPSVAGEGEEAAPPAATLVGEEAAAEENPKL